MHGHLNEAFLISGKETRTFKDVLNCPFIALFVGNTLGILYNGNVRLLTIKSKDVTVMTLKAIKTRIYPTLKQREKMVTAVSFGISCLICRSSAMLTVAVTLTSLA